MGLVPCIAVSALCILLDMFLAEALRKSLVGLVPGEGIARNAALELIAAAEMCACGFELAISKSHSYTGWLSGSILIASCVIYV